MGRGRGLYRRLADGGVDREVENSRKTKGLEGVPLSPFPIVEKVLISRVLRFLPNCRVTSPCD